MTIPTSAPGSSPPVGPVLVVGLGNVLTGDDAVGPTVVRVMEAGFEAPPGVEWVDAGTPGMDLASLLADADAAIVVDSISSDAPPGTVKLYDREALVSRPLQPRTNPHAPGLPETLLSLGLLGLGPRSVLLVGVVPERVEIGVGLSATTARALPVLVRAVAGELRRLGVPLRPRTDASPPDLWWTRSPALAGTVVAPG